MLNCRMAVLLLYSWELSRDKISVIFFGLVFPTDFLLCPDHLYNWISIPQIFLHKILTFYQSVEVFSLKDFPLYSTFFIVLQIKNIIQSGIDVPGNDNDLKKLQLQQLAELNGTFKPLDILK